MKRKNRAYQWVRSKEAFLDCFPRVKLPDRHPFDPHFDQAVDVELCLSLMNGLQARADGGVRRDEKAAAILIGLDRNWIGPDLLGDGDDLIFVEADERTEDRQLGDLLDHRNILQGLRGNLPDALAGQQCLGPLPMRQRLSNPNHESAVEDHPKRRRGADDDVALNLSEGNGIKPGVELIS